MYSKTSVQTTPALQTLVYLPSDSLRADMAAFLMDYIFSDDPELNGPTFTFVEKMCFVDEIFICQHFSHIVTFPHATSEKYYVLHVSNHPHN